MAQSVTGQLIRTRCANFAVEICWSSVQSEIFYSSNFFYGLGWVEANGLSEGKKLDHADAPLAGLNQLHPLLFFIEALGNVDLAQPSIEPVLPDQRH